MWNGTAPTLKSRPISTSAAPISSSASLPMVSASAGVICLVPSLTTSAIPAYVTVPA